MAAPYDTIRVQTLGLIALARPFNAPPMLLAYSIGYFWLVPATGTLTFISGLVTLILIHSAWTIHNDLNDFEIDKANGRKSALISGVVSREQARQTIIILIGLALVAATLSEHRLVGLLFIVLLTGLGWLYNSPPAILSRRPVLSIAALGFIYSGVPALYGLLSAGHGLTERTILFVIGLTLIRMSISILKDFKDSAGDKAHDKRTFYLAYGRRQTVLISVGLALLTYPLVSWISFADHMPAVILLVIVGIIMILNVANRFRLLFTTSEKKLTRIFQRSFVFENYFEAGLLVCFILS